MTTTRVVRDKNQSQIVFDIHGGEKEYLTMSLRTIPNKAPIIKSANENYNLRTDDIDGAQYRPPKVYNHNFQLDISDIEGSKTKPMVNENKKPVDIMSVDDIEGAKPRIQRALPHSNRMTNPLNPQYQLPTKQEPPIPTPKFIRDNISVDDIQGAHSKSYQTDKPPRDIMNVNDISGARPRKRILALDADGTCNGMKLTNTCSRSLQVKDINTDGIFKSTRVTNPLNPVYYYDGQKIEATDYGKHFPPNLPKNPIDFPNSTKDIEGAQADTSTAWYRNFKRPQQPSIDDDNYTPSDVLMLPSMKKQTRELEMQEKLRQYRGDKIRQYENRNMHTAIGTGDPIQSMLRQQREKKSNNRRLNGAATTVATGSTPTNTFYN